MILKDVLIIGGIIIVLISTIIFLILLNRKELKILQEQKNKAHIYRDSIKEIEPKNEDIESFNRLVRGFFKDIYNLDYNLTYLELSEKFKEKNKEDIARFCRAMSNTIYSGRQLRNEELKNLILYFSKILEKTE